MQEFEASLDYWVKPRLLKNKIKLRRQADGTLSLRPGWSETFQNEKYTHLVFSVLSQLQADYSKQHLPKLPEIQKQHKNV